MSWLYRYETSGIQSWILDSNKLRELKSGSALVEALTEQAKRFIGAAGGTILQAAAGSATAHFDSREQLEAFASEWPMYARHHAPGLQVVQAWVEDGNAGEALHLLFERLAERRNRPWVDLPEAGPWVARAGRSGLPAVQVPRRLREQVPGTGHWDRGTVARALTEGEATQRLEELLDGGWSFEDDLASWGEGAVAVLHLDGSGVGRRLRERCKTAERLQRFSAQLRDATWAATQGAFRLLCARLEEQFGRERQETRRLRARPIVVGGDDVTLLLPAPDGHGYAVDWMRLFEQETGAAGRPNIGGKLHCGAGIAFVHAGHPFSLAYKLAEWACRDAKRAAVNPEGAPTTSVLQLRRVTNALADGDAAATTWALGGGADLPDVNALGALVKACGELPRGTLRTWLALADRGDDTGRRATWSRAREIAELREPGRWGRFAQALRQAGADPETGLFAGSSTATPVRDALALLHLGRAR